MAGFLSDQQKNNIKTIVDGIHDTFARPITAYKVGQKIEIATTDGYNSIYKKNPITGSIDTNKVSKVIQARIKYKSFDQDNFYQNYTQEKVIIPIGEIYIKVNYEDYLFMREAKTVELDGKTYAIKSPGKPEGMFGPQYYKFLLIPLES